MVGSSVNSKSNNAHSTYDFLEKKQNHIDQVDLQSFHEGLPQYDEDGFMAELQARPDQDELEESKVHGTW
jgi:hypothetical protein